MGNLRGGLNAPLDIGTTAVLAENKAPLLSMDSRYNYFMKHFDTWKQYVRYRLYLTVCTVLTLYLVFTQTLPLVAACTAFGATFFYRRYQATAHRCVGSQRTVIIGH
ncbi:MAG: hypothetical protein WC607_03685 [Candidatus Micrarchaeia archaeon]